MNQEGYRQLLNSRLQVLCGAKHTHLNSSFASLCALTSNEDAIRDHEVIDGCAFGKELWVGENLEAHIGIRAVPAQNLQSNGRLAKGADSDKGSIKS
jgi:hypothetical protein